MEEQSETQKAGSPPDFKGEGCAIWKNTTKDGKIYLSVQLFGQKGIKVNCFQYEPKQTKIKTEPVL